MQNLIGYIRVSTELQEKNGYGLKIQEDSISKFASENDYNLIKIFRDEAVSGALKDRPALIELLDYAQNNKEAGP